MAWTDINKTSAQSAVTEFLDNLEDWVVNSDEKINESPSSFTSLMASTLGKISAYSFFNMLMAKREITPSTAILAKSLLRQLKSDQISGIYGTPSSIQMIISYPKDDIIDKSVLVGNGKYKLTLNKNTTFAIGSDSVPFTLPFNIDIFTTKYTNNGETEYSTYAMYNTDDVEAGSIVSVTNPYLSTRTDAVINNKKMFSMYVDLKQYVRTTTTFDMTGEPQDMSVEYGDHLVGFVVLYKSQSSDSYVQVNTYLEGETYTDGLLYTLTSNGGSNNIKFKFSKLPNSFNPTNGVIKIVVYTTSGSDGNFTLGQLDDNTVQDMNMAFNQDISDEAQYQLLNIIPTVSIIGSEATGGADDLDIEGIRKLVQESGYNEVITPTSLANKAKAAGFSSYKTRHDLFALEYTLSSYLTDGNGYIVPSKNINAHFALSDIDVDTESNSRFITPSDSFTYDSDTKTYAYVPSANLSPYNTYYSNYKKNKSLEYYNFPFFIRVQNGTSLIATAYDESINISKETQYTYMSNDIYDKASIISMYISRNPISETELSSSTDDDVKLEKDYYKFAFDVYLSDVIYNHLKAIHDGTSNDDEYVKFKLLIKNTDDGSIYEHDIDIKDCTFNGIETYTVTCYAYLKTSSAVLANGQINICDNSLKGIPLTSTQYGFYYIDPKVDVSVAVIFKNTDETKSNSDLPTSYRNYLSTSEQNNGYYVGIIYTVEDVQLCKDISDVIDINTDIKLTQPEYETAEYDIPDTYSETQYKTKSDGSYETQTVTTTLADGTVTSYDTYVVLHNKGDTKQELNGRVGCYNTLLTDWTWSDSDESTGVYNDGTLLGGSSIRAVVQWNKLVIFGGDDGRVGCYDINTGKWHTYNESDGNKNQYRGSTDSSVDVTTTGYVIKGDKVLGTYTDNGVTRTASIRGMKVVPITSESSSGKTTTSYVLLVYGDMGRVVSCRLETNKWNSYDGTKQNSDGIAIFYNNGSCINGSNEQNALYACSDHSYSESKTVDGEKITTTKTILIFAGGSGRICSLTIDDANAGWHNYDTDSGKLSESCIFSDGSVRNYKTVLSMSKYLNSILYLTGIDGVVSVIDLTKGESSLLDDGSSVENNAMYSSIIYGNNFIEAGKGGNVASYNITRGTWTISTAGSGLCDNGTYIDYANIYTIISYGINLLFCGEYGRISLYNTTDSSWTRYDSSDSALTNTGDFIGNTISCAAYDTTEGDSLIYFGGSTGNITYKYKKGEPIYNEEEQTVTVVDEKTGETTTVTKLVKTSIKVKKGSEQICYLKGIPCYSRLYAIKSNYFDVVEAYDTLMDKIDAMDDIFIDDGNLYLGVKNTSGASETFYFKDPTTNETTYLDSLAISLDLGVKFDDNITTENAEFLVESIKTQIISYIKELQNTTNATIEFNINKMLDTIKTDIPSISYFEYYSLNDYGSTKCQTIFHDNAVNDENNEYLCVATTIDESNSDINSQDVVFTPDISITIL